MSCCLGHLISTLLLTPALAQVRNNAEVRREILNHRRLQHPNIIAFKKARGLSSNEADEENQTAVGFGGRH